MNLTLSEVAGYVGGAPDRATGEVRASGCSIDSRTIAPGQIFFAIRGPRFDGHDFLPAAAAAGAAGAVVSRDWAGSVPDLPCIRVDSPTAALGRLARAVRSHWGRLVIGVTGSVGKTTTKEMIASVLGRRFRVWRSRGNLNNHLGLPLSLVGLDEDHDVAVVEMGMSSAGEIRDLAAIALPNEGVVTNVNPVHLEFFESVDAIASAKAELLEGLVGDRRAYLNADDPRVRRMAEGFDGAVVTWGTRDLPTFHLTQVVDRGLEGTRFTVRHQGRDFELACPLPGVHNVSNAAAAVAVGVTHGVDWDDIRSSVAEFATTGLRGVVRRYREGFVLVDDSYNSNPAALGEMIRLVGRLVGFERRILVAGEMLELGPDSPALHARCGEVAADEGFDLIVGVQGAARSLVDAALSRGKDSDHGLFAESAAEAGEILARTLGAGDVVLLKGSRGVHLEQVVESLDALFHVEEDR